MHRSRTFASALLPLAILAVASLAVVALVVASPTYQDNSSWGMPTPPPPPSVWGMVCGIPGSWAQSAQPGCNGQGIPHASVTLSDGGTVVASSKTDEWGSFQLDAEPGRTYTLSAARPGFQDGQVQVPMPGNHDYSISLVPLKVVLLGSVLDSAGMPVPGVSITLCCGEDGERTIVLGEGSNGSFDTSVLAGSYFVSARLKGYATWESQVFVDGSTALDIRMHALPERDVILSGQVTDQHGQPVDGVIINVDQFMRWPAPTACKPYPAGETPMVCDAQASCLGPYCGTSHGDGTQRAETDAEGRYTVPVYGDRHLDLRIEDARLAHFFESIWVPAGENLAHDVQVTRLPERTAPLRGRVVDAADGRAIADYWVSIESPAWGRHECSQAAWSTPGAYPGGGSMEPYHGGGYRDYYPGGGYGDPYYGGYSYGGYPYDTGCAIRVLADGSFAGNVTPGYTVLRVGANQHCVESQDAGGSYRRDCGAEYLPYVQSLMLAPGGGNFTVRLQPRPGPDAVISGYLVDAKTLRALPHGRIEFSNEQTTGYGYASTDGDGSYRIRLRSGYHTVTATVNGYFQWHGTVLVRAGDNDFDVTLQTGGACEACWASYPVSHSTVAPMVCPIDSSCHPDPYWSGDYAMGGMASDMERAYAEPGYPQSMPEPMYSQPMPAQSDGYTDLGGRLGPYDHAARQAALSSEKTSPVPVVALVAVGLLGIAAIRRRLA